MWRQLLIVHCGAAMHFHIECGMWQAVQVMTKICAESERSLDYYGLFKQIMKRAPVPMSPLESLASSAVRTAHKVNPPSPFLLESPASFAVGAAH